VPVIRGTETGSETAPATGPDVIVLAPESETPAPSIRLPRIGDDGPAVAAPQVPSGATAVAPAPKPAQPAAGPSGIRLGALARNAQAFTPQDGLPLLSVILIDAGGDGVDPEMLQTFSFPVTIAVSPEDPEAATKAAAYRAAGAEVLVLSPPVKLGTSSRDLESRLIGYTDVIPVAVGLVDSEEGGFQENRLLIDGAIKALAQEGAGLVVYDRRFNNAQKAADAAGLPVALISAVLDGDGRSTAGIERALDRAAQSAGQQGATLVIGHSYPETVNALFAWVQNQLAPSVQLAPVSAILRR